MQDKSGLYLVGIVALVAVVAIIIMIFGNSQYNYVDSNELTGQGYAAASTSCSQTITLGIGSPKTVCGKTVTLLGINYGTSTAVMNVKQLPGDVGATTTVVLNQKRTINGLGITLKGINKNTGKCVVAAELS